MSAFTGDIARLESAFHPIRAGIGKWAIVESDSGVSIMPNFRCNSVKPTTNLRNLNSDDASVITRRLVVVEEGDFGGKQCGFLDFYRVLYVETAGKILQNRGMISPFSVRS